MKKVLFFILIVFSSMVAMTQDIAVGDTIANPVQSVVVTSSGKMVLAPTHARRALLKQVRDSINAIPFDTTRDDDYWRRAIVNGKWSFFTDPTVKLPGLLKLASKAYKFYTKAFNNYDTAYVVGIDKDWKMMLINNDWFDSYGGLVGKNRELTMYMYSKVTPSLGVHVSYLGIGYTYMFDMSDLLGGNRTHHHTWEMSFATSRFAFEAYKSHNIGSVTIGRFGDYNNGKTALREFDGITRDSWGTDFYYFFNHRKYSQHAAYSYSKIQRRSAGSLIAGFLISNQEVYIDFSSLPQDMKAYLNDRENYYYHYRTYSFLVGYAYNWVFHRNWLFNVTAAPAVGWNHSFEDSADGKGNLFSFNLRARIGLVRNFSHVFLGLQGFIDAHLFHSKKEDFINTMNNINMVVGFRF